MALGKYIFNVLKRDQIAFQSVHALLLSSRHCASCSCSVFTDAASAISLDVTILLGVWEYLHRDFTLISLLLNIFGMFTLPL